MQDHLIIRADASTEIGIGHVMRCLALSQAWQDTGGYATFAVATKVPALEDRLKRDDMDVQYVAAQPGSVDDARQTAALARQAGAVCVVLDGYHFSAEYQEIIKDSALNVLFVDDYGHAHHYYADIVLNQNIYAHESFYTSRESYTRLLLGTRYVLLRKEFLRWRGWNRKIPHVACKVLVTLGGGDPDNVTLKIIRAIDKLSMDELEVKVVVGPSNPNIASLKEAIHYSLFTIHLLSAVKDMPELMAWADIAVSAGGSTSWELAFMGLPTLVLVFAENQRGIATGLDKAGVVLNMGWYSEVSIAQMVSALLELLGNSSLRRQMSQRCRALVDGMGSERVIGILRRQSCSDLGSSCQCAFSS